MAFWSRRPVELRPVAPWQGGGVRAEVRLLPLGRREVPTVVLTVDDVVVPVPVGDVQALVRGRTGVAEASAPPPAFLCRPGAAAPGSPVHDVVARLPGDALALVVDDGRLGVVAVLDGPVLGSFTGWAQELPG